MSSTSPSDLAVAFRSLPRRLHEARGDAPDDVTGGPTAELDRTIVRAARLLGTTGGPEEVADAIDARHPEDWDEAVLDELRTIAMEAGRVLRHIAGLTEGG